MKQSSLLSLFGSKGTAYIVFLCYYKLLLAHLLLDSCYVRRHELGSMSLRPYTSRMQILMPVWNVNCTALIVLYSQKAE
jgi:hypothetical protein